MEVHIEAGVISLRNAGDAPHKPGDCSGGLVSSILVPVYILACTLQVNLFSVEYSVPFFLPNNVSGCDAFITLGPYRWISITATLGGDLIFSSFKVYSRRSRRLGKNFKKSEL